MIQPLIRYSPRLFDQPESLATVKLTTKCYFIGLSEVNEYTSTVNLLIISKIFLLLLHNF